MSYVVNDTEMKKSLSQLPLPADIIDYICERYLLPLPSNSFEVEARGKAEDEAIAELLAGLSPSRPASQSSSSNN